MGEFTWKFVDRMKRDLRSKQTLEAQVLIEKQLQKQLKLKASLLNNLADVVSMDMLKLN
jgi:hypothetical protein